MRRFMNYIKIVGVLFLVLISCNEDRIGDNEFGTITGKVVAMGSNEPIPNARISSQPITSTVFTNSNGEFTINNVPEGEYAVQARAEGFLAAFEPASVLPDISVNVVFEMEVETANNRPPSAPMLTSPSENEVLQSIEVEFTWSSTDPEEDEIIYTLELRNDQNDEVLLFEDLEEPMLMYEPLMLGAKYFWQVSATDNINDPVLSPVGTFEVINAPVDNRFLFVRNIDGNNVIFSADEEGNEFQLTSENKNSYRPRRNVAANRIAYLQSDGAEVDIYTMNRDGTDKRQVTTAIKPTGFDRNEINFSWPPASDMIYFPHFDRLYRINSNGQGIELVYQTTDGSLISEVDVSEFDDIIALKTNNLDGYNINLFTIDFEGTLLNTILTGVPGASSGLNLSVTNNLVLYAYDVSGFENPNYRRLDSRLFIYNMADDTTTEVSGEKPNGTNDLEPIFAPNEADIICTNTSNDGISQRDIITVSLEDDSSNIERDLKFENAFMPDWE
ncbi:MAG: carboxypeptidase-like regulatory domain-containing protein [Flavobacteriales bacterium]|jgi:hypothetical protein|uniref:carboxypeptidase-like regulatory domain-containing protein n=1 Tax=Candidatus Ulvibacter alkanivorans TaxID=2267620 RepID=UPI000DF3C72F|nr:carboxypeptidase-like regulatory domain-containing protein [Candidatus Ulvibacter alkanivorans]MCH2489598.1 carboxypeptidase-like regulatory domain-containing protein [Flavobacteriales bacterium]